MSNVFQKNGTVIHMEAYQQPISEKSVSPTGDWKGNNLPVKEKENILFKKKSI